MKYTAVPSGAAVSFSTSEIDNIDIFVIIFLGYSNEERRER